jgi:hypothetical protein
LLAGFGFRKSDIKDVGPKAIGIKAHSKRILEENRIN